MSRLLVVRDGCGLILLLSNILYKAGKSLRRATTRYYSVRLFNRQRYSVISFQVRNGVFKVPLKDGWMVYCCGHKLADEIRRSKEDELSLFEALDQVGANYLICTNCLIYRRPDCPHETFPGRGNFWRPISYPSHSNGTYKEHSCQVS
jgi:hypothetical protein